MEGKNQLEIARRLAVFIEEVTDFLDQVADNPAIGEEDERIALHAAVRELRGLQLEHVQRDLLEAEEQSFLIVGFSPEQTQFKLMVAERAMTDALTPPQPATGWLSPARIRRAADKVKVVLGSIKSLSKWLEALEEIVAMAGELAKNRLGSKIK